MTGDYMTIKEVNTSLRCQSQRENLLLSLYLTTHMRSAVWTLTSRLRKPPLWAAVTRGEGSNHSQDFPSRLRSVLTDETVTEPEQRARISTLSLHQLTSTNG